MCYRISYLIERVCKKLGIEYQSTHLHKNEDVIKDAIRLQEIYRELHEILGDLIEISERHQIDGLGIMLEQEIAMIEQCDHDITVIAHKMREQKDKENDKNNNNA